MSTVILGYARSPFTLAQKGELAKVRPDEMAAQVIRGLLGKVKVNEQDIEDLMMGCAFPEGEQGLNIGRIVTFLAGLPLQTGGATVNRFCGSSMQAVADCAGAIAMGAGELFIAGGIESMSRIPMGGFNPLPHPGLYASKPGVYMSMGITAENVAKKYNISRKEQEEFSLKSHQKAAKADMSREIIPITRKDQKIDKDGCIRADSNLEKMATLAPAFLADGTVTAATSSPITDGASAVLLASESYADKHKLPKLARVKSFAIAGCEPETMGLGPIFASKKALNRAGIGVKDLDVIEINEAFAAQAIPCIRELGLPEDKVNIEGGGIAIGHPLGATGARITGKAALLLSERKGNYALATQCIGGGQGIAMVLEKI